MTIKTKRRALILENIPKELRKTKESYLKRAIQRLYESKLIDYKENEDGAISVVISEEGKKRILIYDMEKLKLKRDKKWDGYWRIVIFDIPDELQGVRRSLFLESCKK